MCSISAFNSRMPHFNGSYKKLSHAQKEWIRCPRCITKNLKPINMGKNEKGATMLWWICENYMTCNFPLDMSAEVYNVEQTSQQAQDELYPLPRIPKLAPKFHYMYPITFRESEPRSPSVASLRNSSSSGTGSTSSVEHFDCSSLSNPSLVSEIEEQSTSDQKKSIRTRSEYDSTVPSTSKTATTEYDLIEDDMERDLLESERKKNPIRTVRRKNIKTKSWKKLIDEIADDEHISSEILNMEESKLVENMRKVLAEMMSCRKPVNFSLKARASTFRIDDIEQALRICPFDVDWQEARKKMFDSVDATGAKRIAMKYAKSGPDLLAAMGVNFEVSESRRDELVRKRAEALQKRVERVLYSLAHPEPNDSESAVKRRKIDESNEQTTAIKIAESARARILDKMKRKRSAPPEFVAPVLQEKVQYEQQVQPLSTYEDDPLALNLDGLYDDFNREINDDNVFNKPHYDYYEEPTQEREPPALHLDRNSLNMDYEVCRKIWEGQVPVEFTLQTDDNLEQVPYYSMLPRCSYFPVVLQKVLNFFSIDYDGKLEYDKIWLESNGTPMKLHLPIGVLHDLVHASESVWQIAIRTSAMPIGYVPLNKEGLECVFMQSIKEADYLKKKGQTTSQMRKEDQFLLWNSLVTAHFNDFWSINKKFMDTTDKDFEHIPIRVYVRDKPFKQALLKSHDSEGGLRTIGDAVSQILGPDDKRLLVTHGITLPIETPIIFAAKNLAYPDNFVHIAVS
ncbi:unnamed protein product [Caenorhabditis bovis]|uniref:Autophagy protein 5 n=1 Tax=Caenorhabditis bovis TaxID=2654633 RepID=A0A8S1F2C8_9PELO|nr:unnamed protein product [Caenorhabditis bovis]